MDSGERGLHARGSKGKKSHRLKMRRIKTLVLYSLMVPSFQI